MRPLAALVTLKQHRFEVTFAAVAAAVASVWGAAIAIQIAALNADPACLSQLTASDASESVNAACMAVGRQGSEILGEAFLDGQGTLPFSVMGALPFLVGLLGGVPIVARELETRTTQTAWFLFGSRTRWLLHQLWPIGLVLGVAVSAAALAAVPVAAAWEAWGHGPPFDAIGLHGPLVIVRAFAALGLGLLLGAAVGRSLSAFLFGIAFSLVLLFTVGTLRSAWLQSQEPELIGTPTASAEYQTVPGAVLTGFSVLDPEGNLLSRSQARDRATDAGVPPASANDIQDLPALSWYEENGYALVPVGVPEARSLGWVPYDAAFFFAVGSVTLAATALLINRRRPA